LQHLFDNFLTAFWQLFDNFVDNFLTTFLTTFANFFYFFILMVVASCRNKYYGTNFISTVPTSLLIAPGLRTIQFWLMFEQGHNSDADDVSEDKSDDWTNQTVSSTFSADVTITLSQNPLKVPAIAAAADRCKISSRQMTIMLGAVLGSGGATANDVTLSQSTTIKTRNIAREKASTEIHASYQPPEHAVLHWDGKQLAGPEEKLCERLAVLVSGNTKEWIEDRRRPRRHRAG
jgi:hypothetical protein